MAASDVQEVDNFLFSGEGNGMMDSFGRLEKVGKQTSLETNVESPYDPWIQAPSRKRRVVQTRRTTNVDVRSGIEKETKQGSRFEVLKNLEEPIVVNSESFTARLKDVVICAGPSTDARGKSVNEVGEGSTKDSRNKDGSHAKPLVISDDKVVDNSKAISMINLNASKHRTVRIIEDGLENEAWEPNKCLFIGSIRNSGSKGAYHAKTNLRHIYKKGAHVAKKDVRKGPDKLMLEDWPSSSPNEDGKIDNFSVNEDDVHVHNKSCVDTMVQENFGVEQTRESGSDSWVIDPCEPSET
ncbi:hypothetical protein V6N12_020248 [Hibiscus sabdariffa]|uniref:Uncharacterized protein n=1 Tax=Hibiscus sabdariffa TaxID=183260 RepID=A0ABR2A036_9ROSI